MKKGILLTDVSNTVLDREVVLGRQGEHVFIHLEQSHATVYEVSTEANPSSTFYVRPDQLQVLND